MVVTALATASWVAPGSAPAHVAASRRRIVWLRNAAVSVPAGKVIVVDTVPGASGVRGRCTDCTAPAARPKARLVRSGVSAHCRIDPYTAPASSRAVCGGVRTVAVTVTPPWPVSASGAMSIWMASCNACIVG